MIEVKNLRKSFKHVEVLKDISFEIKKGEIVALIGPSGCGKTTTLKMINRLLRPTSGDIRINGESIYDMDVIKLRRSMGYVIQQIGLFPHLTVEENIEIIAKVENYPIEQIKRKTQELMEIIGVDQSFLSRYPNELSGGQQQRIGVARALATDPDIILMDEPFSALDPINREQLQNELSSLQKNLQKTIVIVTHDMDEAIKLADRICVMNDGRIEQYATPEEILKNPQGEFVEGFVGKNKLWQSPEFIRSEDIMITNPLWCAPDITLESALVIMNETKVDCLMVANGTNHKLQGVIRANMIHAESNLKQQVKDVMQTEFVSCLPKQTLADILTVLKTNELVSTPVVSRSGHLQGLITKGSLVNALSQPIVAIETEEAVSA